LKESPNKDHTGKHPLIVILHGGPFSVSPTDAFSNASAFYLLQGYCLLEVNYTGSTSYGKVFLEKLLGNIGDLDVTDCGELT